MNERIIELATKAGFDGELMKHNHIQGVPSMVEVFAELLIKECADNVDFRRTGYVSGEGEAAISQAIKDHFMSFS